jgi:hypothetical protein
MAQNRSVRASRTAYHARASRSLGDLSARLKDNQQVSGYFDIEKPAFTLEQGPSLLKIDQATGLLSGTPDAAGHVEVVVAARIERDVRTLDEKTLTRGNEKVLSTSTTRIGAPTQMLIQRSGQISTENFWHGSIAIKPTRHGGL